MNLPSTASLWPQSDTGLGNHAIISIIAAESTAINSVLNLQTERAHHISLFSVLILGHFVHPGLTLEQQLTTRNKISRAHIPQSRFEEHTVNTNILVENALRNKT